MPEAEFDQYAGDYNTLVDDSIRISGESAEYFARQRVAYMARLLTRRGHAVDRVLDYGCGVGLAAGLLRDTLGAKHVHGVDVSAESVAKASAKKLPGTTFETVDAMRPAADADVCYTCNVFHHIPPAGRPHALGLIRDSLRPGGLIAFWEQNPFNPGTRWAMAHCVFDADAQTLTPRLSRRTLRDNGFDVLATRFLFIFPRAMKWLRFIEPKVAPVLIGAQYMVLGRKR